MKEFEKLETADPRWSSRFAMSHDRGALPFDASMHYAAVAALELPASVPEDIRNHFGTSLNALAYSWYAYDLMSAAELHACASLEYALRERLQLPVRLGAKGQLRPYFLRELLKIAGDQGLLPDSEIGARPDEGPDDESSPTDQLSRILSMIRNHLAHGATQITPQSFVTVKVISETIAELWRDEA